MMFSLVSEVKMSTLRKWFAEVASTLATFLPRKEEKKVVQYSPEFIQRVKAEYKNPMLWEALRNSDHSRVGNFLELGARGQLLEPQWVIDMYNQRRTREVRELAQTLLDCNIRREKLYDEWHKIVKGESLSEVYQRFTQNFLVEGSAKMFW